MDLKIDQLISLLLFLSKNILPEDGYRLCIYVNIVKCVRRNIPYICVSVCVKLHVFSREE